MRWVGGGAKVGRRDRKKERGKVGFRRKVRREEKVGMWIRRNEGGDRQMGSERGKEGRNENVGRVERRGR